jgi:hypothetical protein
MSASSKDETVASNTDDQEQASCANCDQPATVTTGGESADVVSFCDRHSPDSLRDR